MLRLDVSALLSALTILDESISIAKEMPDWLSESRNFAFAKAQADTLVSQLSVPHVPTAMAAAKRLVSALNYERAANPAYAGFIEKILKDVRSRLEDELSGRFLLSLNNRQAILLAESSNFGGEAANEVP